MYKIILIGKKIKLTLVRENFRLHPAVFLKGKKKLSPEVIDSVNFQKFNYFQMLRLITEIMYKYFVLILKLTKAVYKSHTAIF